jgi:type II secretory pathway component PulM
MKRARRAAVLGAAGLGACALLAACSPVQVGAAAIVGSQRITTSALDSQVANLQASAKPYGSQVQITTAEMPTAVLSWLVRFSIMDQLAASAGISVTQAQVQQGVANINSQATSAAAQNGYSGGGEVLVGAGISPQMLTSIGRYQAEELAYVEKVNGGKLPSTTAQNTAVSAALGKAQCQAAKSLNIQISPQFGRMDYTNYAVVAGSNTLSRSAGVPSPASTTGLAPAC